MVVNASSLYILKQALQEQRICQFMFPISDVAKTSTFGPKAQQTDVFPRMRDDVWKSANARIRF